MMKKSIYAAFLLLMAFLAAAEMVSLPEKTSVTTPLFQFDDGERWVVESYGGETVLTPGNSGLEVNGQGHTIRIRNRKFQLLRYHSLTGFSLKLQILEGKGNVIPVWKGADGKLVRLAPRPFAPGNATLRWEAGPGSFPAPGAWFDHWEIRPESDRIRLVMQNADMTRLIPPLEAVEIDFPWFQRTLEPPRFQLINRSGETLRIRLGVTLTDFFGRTLRNEAPIVLEPFGTASLLFPEKLPAWGVWEVRFRLEIPGRPVRESVSSFVAMTPAGPTPGEPAGFLFGVCSHAQTWSYREQEREIEAAALCGAKIFRDSVEWAGLEPQPGKWNFTVFDRIVELLAKQNMQLQGMFAFTARHAAAPETVRSARSMLDWARSAPSPAAWRNYVATMAARYRGRVRFWEVWNEPDIDTFARFDAETYGELLRAASEEIRRADPKARVLTAGFATLRKHRRIRDPRFQEKVLRSCAGAFDIHAYHEHGLFPVYRDVIDNRFLPLRRAVGTTVPWYANETAVTVLNNDRRLQAVTLFQKLLFAWSRGSIGYNWYDLRNDGFNPGDGEHNYGMLTHDFRPKFVYGVYNTLAANFGKARFEADLSRNGTTLYKFRDGNTLLLPCWHEAGTGFGELIRTDAASAEWIDLMNNVHPLAICDGVLYLPPQKWPVILKLRNATRAEYIGNLFDLELPPVLVPGRPTPVTATFRNPLRRTLEVRLVPPSGSRLMWKAGATLRLAAESTRRVAGTLELPAGPAGTFELDTSIPGWKGEIELAATAGKGIPFDHEFRREADFVLDRAEQVVGLHEADPGRRDLHWRGPEDLSVRAWLGVSEHDLLLKVVVTDDRHNPVEPAADLWKGDSVQFGLSFPGEGRNWKIGFARSASGRALHHIWSAPSEELASKMHPAIRVETNRNNGRTYYLARIPLYWLRMDHAALRRGFRFNFIVNDNDGGGRKGWIELAPGLGTDGAPEKFPQVVFY